MRDVEKVDRLLSCYEKLGSPQGLIVKKFRANKGNVHIPLTLGLQNLLPLDAVTGININRS